MNNEPFEGTKLPINKFVRIKNLAVIVQDRMSRLNIALTSPLNATGWNLYIVVRVTVFFSRFSLGNEMSSLGDFWWQSFSNFAYSSRTKIRGDSASRCPLKESRFVLLTFMYLKIFLKERRPKHFLKSLRRELEKMYKRLVNL